jgi:hypothetical protein
MMTRTGRRAEKEPSRASSRATGSLSSGKKNGCGAHVVGLARHYPTRVGKRTIVG